MTNPDDDANFYTYDAEDVDVHPESDSDVYLDSNLQDGVIDSCGDPMVVDDYSKH
jgi:hypothetical protein